MIFFLAKFSDLCYIMSLYLSNELKIITERNTFKYHFQLMGDLLTKTFSCGSWYIII